MNKLSAVTIVPISVILYALRASTVKKNVDSGKEISDLYRRLSDQIHQNYIPGQSRLVHMTIVQCSFLFKGINVKIIFDKLLSWKNQTNLCACSGFPKVIIKSAQPNERDMIVCLCDRFNYPYDVQVNNI